MEVSPRTPARRRRTGRRRKRSRRAERGGRPRDGAKAGPARFAPARRLLRPAADGATWRLETLLATSGPLTSSRRPPPAATAPESDDGREPGASSSPREGETPVVDTPGR